MVYSGSIICGFGVVWGWFVNRGVVWSRVDYGFVDNWGDVWSWLVDNRSWVVYWSWFVNWSWVINWSRLVNWGWVIDWGWVIGSGSWMVWGRSWMVGSGMVDLGGVAVGRSVNWDMGRSMDGCTGLFASIRVVYILRSSMGLAGNNGVVTTMRLVYGVAHSRGIAMLDDLMARLVSQSNGKKTRDCEIGRAHV